MSEKVVITQEQADAIEFYKTHASKSWIVEHHIKEGWTDEIKKGLQNMLLNNLIKALYIGYEVEPEFKVGDWVVGGDGRIGVLRWTREILANLDYGDGTGSWWLFSDIRHATPSEIAEEKERRWWGSNNRGVWKLKEGDILINNGNKFAYEIIGVHSNGNVAFQYDTDYRDKELIRKNYKVVCFAENRLDVKTNE